LPKTAATQRSASACAQTPAEPPREGSMPKQEDGARPMRALPYRPGAKITAEDDGVLVTLSNGEAATSTAHFAIYTSDGAAPRQYDLAPSDSIEETFASSEIAIHGPAGFVRRFSRENAAVETSTSR